MARPSTLPEPAEKLVLRTLRRSKTPLGAYAILERVNKYGIKNSPVVYRALDTLIKSGEVHKINELGAFVACNCHADHTHDISVLTVCQGCKRVDELHDHTVIDHLIKLRSMHVKLTPAAVMELPVTCDDCAVNS
jgi:Fur family zinc uptake transcriptional regulator